MTTKKRKPEQTENAGGEQPDESLLEELEEGPLVQAEVVDGKLVETWVPAKPKSSR